MSERKQRLLAPEILDEVAVKVLEFAQEQGVHVAFVGGYAMQFLGSPR